MVHHHLPLFCQNHKVIAFLVVVSLFCSAQTFSTQAQAQTPVTEPSKIANTTSTKANVDHSKSNLAWTTLTNEQRTALAPLSNEWDSMDELRKKKWLGVAARYSSMKPEEQQRVRERVATWVKLTPEQRMTARENFANTTKTSPEQKSAQWQKYQQLSDEEKLRLANEAKTKKSVTNIQPESKRTGTTVAPLKKGPAPITSAASASQVSVK